MVDQTYYLGAALLAVLLSAAWLFKRDRIFTTATMSGLLWSYLALTGASVERVTETGDRVAAPVGDLQFLMLAAALLSFLAVALHWSGHYPPDDTTDTMFTDTDPQ